MTRGEFLHAWYETAKAAAPDHFTEAEYPFETFSNSLLARSAWPAVESVIVERHHPFCNFADKVIGSPGCICVTTYRGDLAALHNQADLLTKLGPLAKALALSIINWTGSGADVEYLREEAQQIIDLLATCQLATQ